MPTYEICNFDDIRYVSYIMLEERLIKLTKDFFMSLSFFFLNQYFINFLIVNIFNFDHYT